MRAASSPETHQASRNPIRTKTNMWSSKLSLHHHPISQTHTSVWNTSWWLNKQIPTFLVFVWLLGGRLVIISLSCYSMSGQRERGWVEGWGCWRRERGWWVFAENIIGMASVTLSIRLCFASLCVFAGPLWCFIKQGAGASEEEMFVQPLWLHHTVRSAPRHHSLTQI